MRYGYWLPVFGGWLRNIDDEHMPATWDYVRDLCVRAEDLGYDLMLCRFVNREEERLLVPEVMLQSTPGHAGQCHDLLSPGVRVALGREQLPGRADECRPS